MYIENVFLRLQSDLRVKQQQQKMSNTTGKLFQERLRVSEWELSKANHFFFHTWWKLSRFQISCYLGREICNICFLLSRLYKCLCLLLNTATELYSSAQWELATIWVFVKYYLLQDSFLELWKSTFQANQCTNWQEGKITSPSEWPFLCVIEALFGVTL